MSWRAWAVSATSCVPVGFLVDHDLPQSGRSDRVEAAGSTASNVDMGHSLAIVVDGTAVRRVRETGNGRQRNH